jgi:hypothetical protein
MKQTQMESALCGEHRNTERTQLDPSSREYQRLNFEVGDRVEYVMGINGVECITTLELIRAEEGEFKYPGDVRHYTGRYVEGWYDDEWDVIPGREIEFNSDSVEFIVA